MAVKERKQITGTTAQINAYKGHEGQIVWDKEKQTLVGMSGTAGKNYPLAPKTYVDNEVAKVNTEVQKTNAEVAKVNTEVQNTNAEVAKRLPLNGGVMLGDISYRVSNGEFSIKSSTYGAGISLNEATRDNFEGQAILKAQDGTTKSYCVFYPNGDLKVNDNTVDSIVQQSTGFVRYVSGLQVEWVTIPTVTTINEIKRWELTYPLPFIDGKPISVFVTLRGGWGYSTNIQLEHVSLTNCDGTLRREAGDPTNNADIHILAIGWWK